MVRLLSVFVLTALCGIVFAQSPERRLWDGKAPGALGDKPDDIPTITPFLATGEGTHPAMVICPGGAYMGLADHEGAGYAHFLAEHGVSCFVLKYRLGSHGYRHPVELGDAARAVRWVRSKASEFKIDPGEAGIMGSSAGGHLASTLLTHFDAGNAAATDPIDRLSSRPDLGVLCYAVISMGPHTHQGSKQALLGENPKPELVTLLSNELQVTDKTPPTFLWHTDEDAAVDVENSMMFAAALRAHKVPFDLHVYEKGGHGMGLGNNHPWSHDLIYWLKARGWTITE